MTDLDNLCRENRNRPCADADCNDEDGHGGEDDQGELPAVDEGVDQGRGEDRHEEDEHPDLLPDALLHLSQVV